MSNICEASGCATDRSRGRFIDIARASNAELLGQLLILTDLGILAASHPLHDRVDHVGAMLYRLRARLG